VPQLRACIPPHHDLAAELCNPLTAGRPHLDWSSQSHRIGREDGSTDLRSVPRTMDYSANGTR
jgi:hypothetical protein